MDVAVRYIMIELKMVGDEFPVDGSTRLLELIGRVVSFQDGMMGQIETWKMMDQGMPSRDLLTDLLTALLLISTNSNFPKK